MDEEKNIFDDNNLVQNNWIKFSQIGDNIHGTLIAVRDMTSRLPGKEGETVKVYEIKADGGEFHDTRDKKIIEPAIEVKPGEYWNVGGGFMIDNSMRNVKLGQKIGIKFTEERPAKTKGFNPLKIKKVFIRRDSKTNEPVFDTVWLEDNKPFDEEIK